MDHVIGRLYSTEFDLPLRSELPSFRYMVASIPRSGSTNFCIQMWRTGVFGAPMEYINLPNVEKMRERLADGDLLRYWDAVQKVRTTSNGVFGFKAFTPNFRQMPLNAPELLPWVKSDRVILLLRRDRVSQAVSYARAVQTRVWFSGIDDGHPEYQFKRIAKAERYIATQTEDWERIFRRTRVKPLRIFHEDVIADFSSVAARISAGFGIPLAPGCALEVPGLEKQSDDLSAEWKARYLEDLEREGADLATVD